MGSVVRVEEGKGNMKHSEFIKLYEARERNGTWENWRERHRQEPRIPCLGDLTHDAVLKLPAGCTSSLESLRAYLLANYDSGAAKIRCYPNNIPPGRLAQLMQASGLAWFTKGDHHLAHWTHKLRDDYEQNQKAV